METTYAPAIKLPAHSHELTYFCFVIEGSFTDAVAQGLTLRRQTAALSPQGFGDISGGVEQVL